jgi:hypothetical protein
VKCYDGWATGSACVPDPPLRAVKFILTRQVHIDQRLRIEKMANEWYCDLMGKVVGPIGPAELLQMVKKGEVTSETLVRKDDSKWYPADEVGGLFEAAFKDHTADPTRMVETEYFNEFEY